MIISYLNFCAISREKSSIQGILSLIVQNHEEFKMQHPKLSKKQLLELLLAEENSPSQTAAKPAPKAKTATKPPKESSESGFFAGFVCGVLATIFVAIAVVSLDESDTTTSSKGVSK